MTSPRSAARAGLAAGIGAALTLGASVAVTGRARAREAAARAAFPPEGEILDIGGIPVHAVVRGQGPDLVMLHGASGNSRDFTFDLMGRLSDRFRCIAFDRPGLGHTGRVRDRYDAAFSSDAETPAEQATLLARAARHLGADRPLVLGHSFGGTIALAWALDHPARALVLLAAASNRWEGGLGPLYAINSSALGGALAVPLLTASVPLGHLRRITARIFAPNPVPAGYHDHVGAALTLRRRSLRANSRQMNSLKPFIVEMEARYADLDLPIEWIHGTADTIVPIHVHAERFRTLVPHTNLTRLPGIGHMPHHADPDATVAAVLRAHAAAG